MKRLLPFLFLACSATLALAEIPGSYYPRPVFSDNFSGTEFGKRWGHYKSSSVIKDGMLVGITGETSDHPAVDNVKIDGERDLEVSVKFQIVSDQTKSWNIWFDDKDYKGSHAGHICSVTVTPKAIVVADAKTGNFRNDFVEKRAKPEGLSLEDKEYLKTKTVTFPTAVSLQDWHTIVARTKADEVEVSLDGKVVGTFKSEGIAHETKSLISLTTNRVGVNYKDFSIKGATK